MANKPLGSWQNSFYLFLFACLDALNIFFLVKLIYSKFDFKNILVYSSMNLSTCIDLCN